MSYLGGIYQSCLEVVIQWSVISLNMTIEGDLFNLFSDIIYGNLRFTVGMMNEFLRRGMTQDGWPVEGWPYLPRVMIVRDLLILAMELLGELSRLEMPGTVGSVWRCRNEARRGGGRGGGMGGGGSGGMTGGGGGRGGFSGSVEWF